MHVRGKHVIPAVGQVARVGLCVLRQLVDELDGHVHVVDLRHCGDAQRLGAALVLLVLGHARGRRTIGARHALHLREELHHLHFAAGARRGTHLRNLGLEGLDLLLLALQHLHHHRRVGLQLQLVAHGAHALAHGHHDLSQLVEGGLGLVRVIHVVSAQAHLVQQRGGLGQRALHLHYPGRAAERRLEANRSGAIGLPHVRHLLTWQVPHKLLRSITTR